MIKRIESYSRTQRLPIQPRVTIVLQESSMRVRSELAALLMVASLLGAVDASATPGGPVGSVQYNADGTNFGGDAGFTFSAASSTITLGGSGNDGVLKLVNEGGTDYTTTLQSGATSNYTLTLPIDDGNANQLLKTNGSGVLSWADGVLNPMTANLNAGGRSITNLSVIDALQAKVTGELWVTLLGGTKFIKISIPAALSDHQYWYFPATTGAPTQFVSDSFAQTLTNKTLGSGTTLGANLDADENAITNLASIATTAGTDGERAIDFTDNGVTLVAPSSGTRLGAKGGEVYKSDLGDGTSPKLLLNSGNLATASDIVCTDNPATNQSDCQVKAEREIDLNIESPSQSKSGFWQFKGDFGAFQILRVSCSVIGSSTPSIAMQIAERTESNPNSGGTSMLSSALSCTDQGTAATTSFADDTLAAGAPAAIVFPSDPAGTVQHIRIHIQARRLP